MQKPLFTPLGRTRDRPQRHEHGASLRSQATAQFYAAPIRFDRKSNFWKGSVRIRTAAPFFAVAGGPGNLLPFGICKTANRCTLAFYQNAGTRHAWRSWGQLGPSVARAIVRQLHKRLILQRNLEAPPGFEPGVEVLQTSALPLGDGAPEKQNGGSSHAEDPPANARRVFKRAKLWSGKRDSNPRLRPWQGRTLPLSYSRSNLQRYHTVGPLSTIAHSDRANGPHQPPLMARRRGGRARLLRATSG